MEQQVKQKVHMIGHAHIDPVWLWTWREGYQEIKATFRSALDRMNEFDQFYFTSSSAAFYEWIEQNEPEMFAEIKQRVQEGRWEIAGGWWVEPDCNIPSGESFVRHALYGQSYFKQKFGRTAKICFNPDSFGHAAMLPQILRKSGLDAYVFMRPGINEKTLESDLFMWQSPDGSQIPVFRIVDSYNGEGPDLVGHIQKTIDQIGPQSDQMMCFYGVGNHGGGPTIALIKDILKYDQEQACKQVTMSVMERFFNETADHQKQWPVLADDLQFHAKGCYSAHSRIKHLNRKSEQALLRAEKISAMAGMSTDLAWPEEFDRAWKNVLFNQFHDILAGTSLECAYQDAEITYHEAMAIAQRAENAAAQKISWRINLTSSTQHKYFVVFNPHAWPAGIPVEAEFSASSKDVTLVDADSQEVSFQWIQPHATANEKKRISFIADLPGFGYAVFTLKQAKAAELMCSQDEMKAVQEDNACITVENQFIKYCVSKKTGWIESIYDKRQNREMLSGPAGQPAVYDDTSDTWSHGVERYDELLQLIEMPDVACIDTGPVRTVIRVKGIYQNSRIRQDYVLYHDQAKIDVQVKIDWHEQLKVLKIRTAAAVDSDKVISETPYGLIERLANGDEWPCQTWIDISDDQAGLGMINSDKYSFSADKGTLSLTVLRSPVYAYHDPVKLDPETEYRFIDQGEQLFDYAIVPHKAGAGESDLLRWACEMNQPPVLIEESYHEGPFPLQQSWLEADQPIVMSVAKKAEQNDDWIMRFYEPFGRHVSSVWQLRSYNQSFELTFSPHEIKTVRIVNKQRPVIIPAEITD